MRPNYSIKKRPLRRPRTQWVDVVAQYIRNKKDFDDAYDREMDRYCDDCNGIKLCCISLSYIKII